MTICSGSVAAFFIGGIDDEDLARIAVLVKNAPRLLVKKFLPTRILDSFSGWLVVQRNPDNRPRPETRRPN